MRKILILISLICLNTNLAQAIEYEDEKVKLKVSKTQEQEIKRIYDFFIESLGKDAADYQFQIKDSKVVNAYATLNKKIILTTGLINSLESESALALVVAHELGHVERKHVIQGISRNIFAVGLGVVLGIFGKSQTANATYGGLNQAQSRMFSRSKERSADLFAIHMVNKYYCDVPNKLEFFENSLKRKKSNEFMKYLSTHPLSEERIEYLELLIKDEGCVL